MFSGYDIRVFWKYKFIVLIADYMISLWKLASTVGFPDVQDAGEDMIKHESVYVPDTFGLCFRGLDVLQRAQSLIQVHSDETRTSPCYSLLKYFAVLTQLSCFPAFALFIFA